MARRCREYRRTIPKATVTALRKTARMSNDASLKYLSAHRVPKMTPLSRLSRLVHKAGKKHRVKVRIVTQSAESWGHRRRTLDALASSEYNVKDDGTVRMQSVVHFHPVLQYYPEGYTKDVIGHEMDHIRVQRKRFCGVLRGQWKLPKDKPKDRGLL